MAAVRQRCVPVEYADIVEPEKPALEDVSALDVLAVDPPGEIEHQLVEDALEKISVALAAAVLAVDLVDAPGRPGMHRRVDVAECPFIGRQLAIGVHVPVARQQQQLVLGEARIDQRQGDGMKGEVPGGVPRVFPLVRHRDDVGIVQMQPVGIASVPPRCAAAAAAADRRSAIREYRSSRTALTTACRRAPGAAPAAHRDRRCPAAALRRIRRLRLGADRTRGRNRRDRKRWSARVSRARNRPAFSGRQAQPIMRRDFGAPRIRVHRLRYRRSRHNR